jgi:hypothetical protein
MLRYPGTTGYWIPKHTPRLFVCCKVAASRNDKLLDARHTPRLFVCFVKVAVSWNDRLLGCQGIHQGCLVVLLKSQYPGTTGYWMPRHRYTKAVFLLKWQYPGTKG